MKTYLIFKRQENINNSIKVVTKVVPVEIPQINSGEGWTLAGHTDVIDVINESEHTERMIQGTIFDQMYQKAEEPKTVPDKFIANVPGTAKLVRSKNIIKIVARRGKKTLNQTTPNSVCISDDVKMSFFKHCKEYHGSYATSYMFSISDGKNYDRWNKFIDEEYQRQKANFALQ